MSDYLAIMLANDEGYQEHLAEQAGGAVAAMADEGYGFDELADALRVWSQPKDWEDQVYEWALAYVENQDPGIITAELFRGDWNDAERWSRDKFLLELYERIPMEPGQLWEYLHPDMPPGEWGGELDIPARAYWWMENPEAQRELVEELLTRAAQENPPRARRNFTRPQHRIMAEEYEEQVHAVRSLRDRAEAIGNTQGVQNLDRIGDELRGRKWAHQDSGDAFHPTLDRVSATTRSYRESAGMNPPYHSAHWDAISKWFRGPMAGGSNPLLSYWMNGAGGGYYEIVPYSPRSARPGADRARGMAAHYMELHGQKPPKGTKWILMYQARDRTDWLATSHRTLKAAKAQGLKDSGAKVNKPRKRRARKNPSAYTVQVKTSSRAQPKRVKLPSSAKPETVKGRVIHRSLSYAGGKLRLLKGWTVSSKAGVGMAKFKTKAAAERYARGR